MSLGLSIVVGAVGVCLVLAVAIALIRSRRPVRGLIGSGAQGLVPWRPSMSSARLQGYR